MRKYIFLFLLLGWSAGASAFVYEAYNGNVEFDHRFHRDKFACKECHSGPPGHMEFDRESAHTFCIGCHERKKAGPIKHCAECHKVS
ncbi:cytochrome c3 family protein [Geobacter sp. DSM 9736]|uniref:cytochrome c3 family protein n=1 Tax=Geobacter sp. DSM 9736 TaxID=1277350 RepID=UPI000B511882|nr:cytochrome c3 family protein [Geobacter sp. DSM 9736]SNB46074.1 hypothetical protein SAMN06269301_1514 [Geobacter sp. DSM 9736]